MNEDPLKSARGVWNGLLISVGIWALILFLAGAIGPVMSFVIILICNLACVRWRRWNRKLAPYAGAGPRNRAERRHGRLF